MSAPLDVNVVPGGIFDLIVTVVPPPSGVVPTYVWRKNRVPIAPEGRILGLSTPMLTVTDAVTADSGAYDLLVTWSPCPTSRSEPAGVTVLPPPACFGDADGSRTVNFLDITTVLVNFGVACP
jgi:hypothetical protein